MFSTLSSTNPWEAISETDNLRKGQPPSMTQNAAKKPKQKKKSNTDMTSSSTSSNQTNGSDKAQPMMEDAPWMWESWVATPAQQEEEWKEVTIKKKGRSLAEEALENPSGLEQTKPQKPKKKSEDEDSLESHLPPPSKAPMSTSQSLVQSTQPETFKVVGKKKVSTQEKEDLGSGALAPGLSVPVDHLLVPRLTKLKDTNVFELLEEETIKTKEDTTTTSTTKKKKKNKKKKQATPQPQPNGAETDLIKHQQELEQLRLQIEKKKKEQEELERKKQEEEMKRKRQEALLEQERIRAEQEKVRAEQERIRIEQDEKERLERIRREEEKRRQEEERRKAIEQERRRVLEEARRLEEEKRKQDEEERRKQEEAIQKKKAKRERKKLQKKADEEAKVQQEKDHEERKKIEQKQRALEEQKRKLEEQHRLLAEKRRELELEQQRQKELEQQRQRELELRKQQEEQNRQLENEFMQRYLPTQHTTPTTTHPQTSIPQQQPISQPTIPTQQPAIPPQPIYSHFGMYQPPSHLTTPQSQPFANQLYTPYSLPPQQQLHLVSQMQTQLLNSPAPQPPMQPPQQQYQSHAHVTHGHFASPFHKDDQLREQEELLINEVMNLNFDATKMSYLNFPMDYSQPTPQTANGQARRSGPPGFDSSSSRPTGYQPPKATPPGFGSQSVSQPQGQAQSGYFPPSIQRAPPGLDQRNAQQAARPVPPGFNKDTQPTAQSPESSKKSAYVIPARRSSPAPPGFGGQSSRFLNMMNMDSSYEQEEEVFESHHTHMLRNGLHSEQDFD